MLDFLPERIGHACCLEEDAWRKLKISKIPVCAITNTSSNSIVWQTSITLSAAIIGGLLESCNSYVGVSVTSFTFHGDERIPLINFFAGEYTDFSKICH